MAQTLSPEFLIIASVAVLIAGIAKGGFGGGGAFVASPLMAIVIDPAVALAVMLPLLMVMDVATVRAYWRQWSTRDVAWLMVGALPGIAIGAWLYSLVPADVFRIVIGVICLAFVAFQLARSAGLVRTRKTPLPLGVGIAAGTVAGFTSFVAHAGGPPVLVYLLSRSLGKLRFQATTVALFAVINAVKAVFYGAIGIFTLQTLSLTLAPVALAGALIGVVANRFVPETAFFGLTYVLLVGAGGRLIWSALT